MSSTHTLHEFMPSHRSKSVMVPTTTSTTTAAAATAAAVATTTSTTNIGQQTVPKAHKISMSSNQFGLVEIVEVIRTSSQVEMVNHLENDVGSTNVDTIVREPMGIHNSAAKHKDFSRIMVFKLR